LTKIRGVIFDLEGILTDTSEYHYMAWKLLASGIDIHIDKILYNKLKDRDRVEALEIILRHGGREDDFSEMEKLTLATKKNNRYMDMINQFTKANLLDGVENILEKLEAYDVKVGVASRSKNVKQLIHLMGIEKYVNYIADPVSVYGKAESNVFLQAVLGLELGVKHCVGIAAKKEAIQSIKATRMKTIGIGKSEFIGIADKTYEKIKDLSIEELLG